jgi:hypothetical protein
VDQSKQEVPYDIVWYGHTIDRKIQIAGLGPSGSFMKGPTKAPSKNMSKDTLWTMIKKRDRIIKLMGESAAREMKRLSDKEDMELKIVRHQRDELLTEIRHLEGLLSKG